MSVYTYWAKDRQGHNIKDIAEAINETELIETLHQRQLIVVSVKESKQTAKTTKKKEARSPFFTKKVTMFDMLLFTSQLSAMLESGIHLLQALKSLSKEVRNNDFKVVIEQVKQNVEDGSSFHEALAKHPKTFSNIFVNLIMAGEVSGNLPQIMDQYSIYLEKTISLRRKVKAAVSYPIVIILLAISMVIGVVWKLIPIFKTTYAEFGVALPAPTQLLIDMNNLFTNHFSIIVLTVFSVVMLTIYIGKTKNGRLWIDTFKLDMPIFGALIKYATMARFARTFGVLVSSGLPILESINIVSHVTGNTKIENSLQKAKDSIQQGNGIAEALKNTGVFPEIIIQMVDTGEQTGRLDKMLLKSADFYDKQAEATASILTTILEPILIVSIGVIIGFILIALFLPIFKLGQVFSS